MPEKCKTCNHFEESSARKNYGSCETLPGLIDMSHFERIWLSGEFGCHAHVSRPKDPEIVAVVATYKTPTGVTMSRNCSVISQEDWEKVIAAVEKQRRQGRERKKAIVGP